MSETTRLTVRTLRVRVDVQRSTHDNKWRWAARVPGHILADSGEGYSRRIDCVKAAMRVVGARQVTWYSAAQHGSTYGQTSDDSRFVEFFIWHPQRWHQ